MIASSISFSLAFSFFWLTSAINRTVKEPKPSVIIITSRRLTPYSPGLTDTIGRCELPRWHLTPAVVIKTRPWVT